MTTIASLEAELAALDAFLAEEEWRPAAEIAAFVETRLRLDNGVALAARLARPLGEIFPDATPVGEWFRWGGVRYDVRQPTPAEERAFQWSCRYPMAVVATLERGGRPPLGWTPGPLMAAATSAEPWDRLWACSEIVRLGLGPTEHLEHVLVALDDGDLEVRRWAWLAVIRWAELARETESSLREAIARRAPSAHPDVAPLSAWAAMLVECTAGLGPALAQSLDGARETVRDALTVIDWLGPKLDDLGAQIEPLIDAEDQKIACGAVRALIRNAPSRWRKVWSLSDETQINPPRKRPRNARPVPPGAAHMYEGPSVGPSTRAFAAQDALYVGASLLGEDAAAAIVEHAEKGWVLPILARLGPLARAASPALVHELEELLERSPESYRITELSRALASIGGPIACAALERLAPTSKAVALFIPDLGDEASPALQRLLAAPLTVEIQRALLNGIGAMRAPDPGLLPDVLHLVDAPKPQLRLMACFAAGAFELDDATAVRLASTFIASSAVVRPYWRELHLAANRLAPIWAARIEHETELVALRCIEALGWTRQYGDAHVPALRSLAERLGDQSVRGRSALTAAERITDPEPMFRPNS